MVSIVTKENPNQIIMEGEFPETEISSVLRDIALYNYSGMLKIQTKRTEYRVFFKEGLITYTENSKIRMDQLILELVRKSGLISRETIIKCEKKKSKMMKSLLEVLVEEGHVSMLLYSKIISFALRLNIIRILLEKKGHYLFETRKSVREIHAVKPLEIKTVQSLLSVTDEAKKELLHIINSVHNNITSNRGTDYLSINKSLFQNFLVTEMDFFNYLSKSIKDYSSGKWTIQSSFSTQNVLNTFSLYLFRTLVLTGIIFFLYLATMTAAFEINVEPKSVKNFYFFKISFLALLESYENEKDVSYQELVKSGIITEDELHVSGINSENNNIK